MTLYFNKELHRGVVLGTDGSVHVQLFEEPLYQTIGKVVKGWTEIVRLPGEPYVLIVNEEGLLLDMPVNAIASMLYHETIVGPAVIMRVVMTDEGPDIAGLADDDPLLEGLA